MEELRVLISRDQIQAKVEELARLIRSEYGPEELILICNLKGAFIFLADLCRELKSPLNTDFIAATSYKGTKSTGDVRIIKDLKMDVRDRHVLLVEDIVDTGLTVGYILDYLKLHHPRSLKICTLLDKKVKRDIDITVDYCGFEIEDRFVVGYGLDYNERYRELDYIAELVIA